MKKRLLKFSYGNQTEDKEIEEEEETHTLTHCLMTQYAKQYMSREHLCWTEIAGR